MIRGLPPHMRRAGERFAKDYKSKGRLAKGRTDALRAMLGREADILIAAAVYGIGPQKLKEAAGGSFESCQRRIHKVLDIAASFYGLQIGRK